jgi:hypothetical protein
VANWFDVTNRTRLRQATAWQEEFGKWMGFMTEGTRNSRFVIREPGGRFNDLTIQPFTAA